MFLSLVEKRRSIRKFLNKPIEEEKIDVLIETALRSPSSMGKNPWTFIVIQDPERLAQLAVAKQFGSAFIKNAPLGIVVCADAVLSDVWIEDAAIATIYLHLAAASMDLGSCWIQIRNRMHNEATSSQDFLTQLLNIPDNMKPLAMVAIGYPDEEKSPHGKDELQYEKVFREVYGVAYKSGLGEFS